jgi:glutamyl endopeptidase
MHRLSYAAHVPVSSRALKAIEYRVRSSPPSFGGDGRRYPVSPEGFEAIPDYRPKTGAQRIAPRRNISELTYGPPVARLQVGTVGSTQVPVANTQIYPWRATAALQISVPHTTETFYGTGWFIGPRTVITAAHVVYPREGESYLGWAGEIEVIPGQNGPNAAPYGSFKSTTFYCPTAWQADGDVRVDYGVIVLADPIGNLLGSFGYATYADDDLRSTMANLSGYPLISPDGSGIDGRQWYSAGDVFSVDESFIYYQLDTRDGESGSCVYRNIGDDSFAMAIHTAATGPGDRGLRIIEPVYENLQTWAAL